MPKFDGQVVIITGGSDGIGFAVAERFVTQGARVVIVARTMSRLEAAAEALRELGGEVLPISMDVSDLNACQSLVKRTVEHYGALHGLVNNAALHHRGAFTTHAASDLVQMVQVNLSAPIYLTRSCVPHLVDTSGFVVNIASLAGCVPTPGSSVYSATKFGLRALSRALAEELRSTGVRVSVVSPGPVDTAFIMDNLDSVTDLTLSQPVLSADTIAEAVLRSAEDGALERKLPARSGVLATAAYLVPSLARKIRPLLERKGRKKRLALLASRQSSHP